MRLTLDAATKDFNDKQYEKIKKEWEEEEEEKNRFIMESVNEEEENKIVGDLEQQCWSIHNSSSSLDIDISQSHNQ